MAKKPTYEELEQKVRELEKESLERKQMEEALKSERDKLKALLDGLASTSIGVDIVSIDYEILQQNQTLIDRFGNIVGKKCYKEYMDLEEPCRFCPMVKALKNKRLERAELRGADGRDYEILAAPLTNQDGTIDRVIEVIQDITERKLAGKDLLFKENIIRSSSSVIATCDLEGNMTHGNPSFLKTWGFDDAKEFLGRHFSEFWVLKERLDEIMQVLRSKGKWFSEMKARRKDGTLFDVQVSAATVYDEEGNPIALTSTSIDITDRKRAEEALRESEEQFRAVVDNTSDYIMRYDRQFKHIYANRATLEITGLPPEDYLGKTHREMGFPPDLCELWEENIQQVFDSGQQRKVEFDVKLVERLMSLELQLNPEFATDGSIKSVIGISRDITERKQLEEELRQSHKMEAIGTLAGGIAHDFNNILGIILGNSELAMDDVPDWNPARLNLEEIKIASLRAKDVVRQLLSFTRKTDQERKPVKINPIVTGALKLLRSSIPTSIEIRSNIPRESAIILADPTQTNQIMINLCTNAAQAMEEDGGVLEISLDSMTLDESTAQSYELSSGRYVKLTINDTGHGIDPEIKDRIFDPYFTTREVGKGSGMGLAVVHGIVTNHDGAIFVDREIGKGASLNIFLPIVERKPAPEVSTDEDLPTGKERILFVDDEVSIVRMSRQRLERIGYKVASTTSPIEALDLFRSKPDQFDLVITDLTMPKMTGDQLVKGILNIRPDMPIIICTGFSEKMDGEKARAIGASGYLEKPHKKHDLAKLVRKVLDEK